MTKVFIDGSAGTTGLRIHERLKQRGDLELLAIAPELHRDPAARAAVMDRADIVFLCLPDAAAREAVTLIANPKVRVLDTSTAHRTAPGWQYGFPELSPAHRRGVAASKRVAVPGCHASGFVALMVPLLQTGILRPDFPACCFSLTGYSGGGKSMIAEYEAFTPPAEYAAPRLYGLTQAHKHLKEMKAVTGLAAEPVFLPVVDDYYSGMLVSVPIYASQMARRCKPQEVAETFASYYKGAKLVKVLPGVCAEGMLSANALAGKDLMEIMVSGNEERMVVSARFDNLGKGASGAAIQCMNLMLGLDETEGLEL